MFDDVIVKTDGPDRVEFSSSQTKAKRRKPSLVRAMGKVFWLNFLLAALFKIANDAVQFVQPQLLE